MPAPITARPAITILCTAQRWNAKLLPLQLAVSHTGIISLAWQAYARRERMHGSRCADRAFGGADGRRGADCCRNFLLF